MTVKDNSSSVKPERIARSSQEETLMIFSQKRNTTHKYGSKGRNEKTLEAIPSKANRMFKSEQEWTGVTPVYCEVVRVKCHYWLYIVWKDLDAGKDLRQKKGKTEDEMVGWHHLLDGHVFEQTPGVCDGQGSLKCCSPQVTKSWTWLSDWTDTLGFKLHIFTLKNTNTFRFVSV